LGYELHPIAAGVLVLGLNEGAYAAEVVRGAIVSRPKGQTEACIALGLSPMQRMWRVILPQSIPVMLPGFGNIFVDLMKATALVSLVTIQDLTYVASSIRRATGETFVLLSLLLLLYFALALVLSAFSRYLEKLFALDRAVSGRRLLITPEAGI
jgi:polar amino acid transport system permease protein